MSTNTTKYIDELTLDYFNLTRSYLNPNYTCPYMLNILKKVLSFIIIIFNSNEIIFNSIKHTLILDFKKNHCDQMNPKIFKKKEKGCYLVI